MSRHEDQELVAFDINTTRVRAVRGAAGRNAVSVSLEGEHANGLFASTILGFCALCQGM